MSFWFKTTGIPLVLAAIGVVVALTTDPKSGAASPFFVVAFFWFFFTAKARRIYWSSRLRARATHDERRSRSAAS